MECNYENSLRISSVTLLSVSVLGMVVPGTTAFASEYSKWESNFTMGY